MKILKVCWGAVLLVALVAVVQLADPPTDSPAARFQRLPDVSLKSMTEAEWAAGRTDAALLLLDHIIESDLPEKAQAVEARREIFAKLASENTPMSRLKATGWAAVMSRGNAFENLAGSTVADAALYGEIAELARQGGLEGNQDEFIAALNSIRGIASVFPPAEGAMTLAKAARSAGALNDPLTKQLRQMLGLMQSDPKSALAVEKFKENFMPMFELAKRCRTWGEFQVILQQADSPDQMKVLTKMASASPDAAKRLSQVLAVAAHAERATSLQCLDYILRQGPKGLDALYAAIGKGAAGLKFVVDHPSATPQDLTRVAKSHQSPLDSLQDRYQSLRYRYGAAASAMKYLVIAVLCGLLVLTVVPGRYLEKLIARPGSRIAAPGPVHYLLVALAVGAVLSGLAYLLSMAARPAAEPSSVTATTGENAVPVASEQGGSAFLTGTVVLLSLAIHAVVWFYARGKIREVEDDEAAGPALRLKRLENLDIFLDLPLFTGLALTVVAFILITLNAGMSRHFAYTSTVVGILSSVSLRIRYQYPLKERLIQMQ